MIIILHTYLLMTTPEKLMRLHVARRVRPAKRLRIREVGRVGAASQWCRCIQLFRQIFQSNM